ncbi:GerW family sporulation protein [Sporanaerobacter acetigenes]|uniref:Sporulation protein YtfJ n=2 Tax=Sporanaerobacter acetigenes TaxID=165813 RepID=A0A1M5XMS0_9FIRM|nr:GerW family sporulation protein [Sporanaerobacter acetigenes]SHI01120.1 sporulation protein YtfJ [Sporanaerobacter acetigenes DSM 13106]
MPTHPIQGLMETTMSSLKDMVDVNIIVGDPVQSPDGSVIIPVSKVSFGFASGGTEFNSAVKKGRKEDNTEEEKLPFGGGTGAGVTVNPVAFMIVGNNQMKLMPVDEGSNALSNLFDLMGNLATNLANKDNQNGNANNTNMGDINS